MSTVESFQTELLVELSQITWCFVTIVIFLNQTRMKVGMVFGNPETTPGGLALKFYASVRINLTRTAQIKSGDEIIGNRVKTKIVKNKVAAPFKIAEFDIYYNRGISLSSEIIDLGVKLKFIDKKGSWFAYGDTKIGQGRETAITFLEQNPDILREIESKIKNKSIEQSDGK